MAEYNKRAVGSMYEDMAVKYLVSQEIGRASCRERV